MGTNPPGYMAEYYRTRRSRRRIGRATPKGRVLKWNLSDPPARAIDMMVAAHEVCLIDLRPGHCHACGHVTDQPICWICRVEVEWRGCF